MSERLEETHEFLTVLRDAFFGMIHLRAELARTLDSRLWEEGVRVGQTAYWGGLEERDETFASVGAWAAKPDTSQVTWGIRLKSTPTHFEVESEIEFERDPETHVELWSKVTTHDSVEDASAAIKAAVEDLLRRTSFLDALDTEPPEPALDP